MSRQLIRNRLTKELVLFTKLTADILATHGGALCILYVQYLSFLVLELITMLVFNDKGARKINFVDEVSLSVC